MFKLIKKMFSSEGKEKDPICGMSVVTENAQFQSNYQGKNYYFCSEHCKTQFDENPAEHVK